MESGLTTAVLKGANAPKYIAPDMSQDHLEANQGDFGPVNLQVEHVSPGREVVRGLPATLETSTLPRPRHPAGKGNVSTRSQKPASPGKVGTGR